MSNNDSEKPGNSGHFKTHLAPTSQEINRRNSASKAYLIKRACDPAWTPIEPSVSSKYPVCYTKTEVGFARFVPSGWAYIIPDIATGEPSGQYLLRPEWPDEPVYDKDYVEVPPEKLPKFLSIGNAIIYPFPLLPKMEKGKVLAIHEKVTSAAVWWNLLGCPSVAISGCWGWGKDKELHEPLQRIIMAQSHGATVYLMPDGDMWAKPLIKDAVENLGGIIQDMRPDLNVVTLAAPNKAGWDDFAAEHVDTLRDEWAAIIASGGDHVIYRLPAQYYIKEHSLTTYLKGKLVLPEPSAPNIARLLDDRDWRDWRLDYVTGYFYRPGKKGKFEVVQYDAQLRNFRGWLQEHPYRGHAMTVRKDEVREAFNQAYEDGSPRCSVLLHDILASMPPVTEEQAREAVHSFLTVGYHHIGPMDQDQAEESLMDMFAWVVAKMGNDINIIPQFIAAWIAPSGVGKTQLAINMTQWLDDYNYPPLRVATFKDFGGDEGKRRNLIAIAKTHIFLVGDELSIHLNKDYKEREEGMFTFSTTRVDSQRDLYKNGPLANILRATLMVTAVDESGGILSASGVGGRRYLAFFADDETKLNPQAGIQAVRTSAKVLFRWGWQVFQSGKMPNPLRFMAPHEASLVNDGGLADQMDTFVRGPHFHAQLAAYLMGGCHDNLCRFEASRLAKMMCGSSYHNGLRSAAKDLFVRCGARKWDGGKKSVRHRSEETPVVTGLYVPVGNIRAFSNAIMEAILGHVKDDFGP